MALRHTPSVTSSSNNNNGTSNHGWLDEALALLDGYDSFAPPAIVSAAGPINVFAPSVSYALDGGEFTISADADFSIVTAFNKMQQQQPQQHQLQFQFELPQVKDDPATESPGSPSSSSVSPTSSRRSRTANQTRPPRDEPVMKRPRKLPRAEIIRLRGEVESLTAHLDQLQQAKDDRANRSSDDQLVHKIRALFPSLNPAEAQLKELRKSELINQKLKRQLAEQATLQVSLQALLTELNAVQDLDIIQELEATESQELVHAEPFFSNVNENPNAILAQLRRNVQKMSLKTKSIHEMVSASGDVRSVFNHSKSTGDMRGRPLFEIMANTPADCGFEQLARQSWEMMMHFAETSPVFRNSIVTKLSITDTTHEKHVNTRVQFDSTVLELNGLNVVTKFEDPDFIAFIFSSLLTISGVPDLVIREHGWMIATHNPLASPSSPGSHRTSVFQTMYGQTPETRTGVPFPKDCSMARIQECVMKCQNERMRSCVGMLQNSLRSELTKGISL